MVECLLDPILPMLRIPLPCLGFFGRISGIGRKKSQCLVMSRMFDGVWEFLHIACIGCDCLPSSVSFLLVLDTDEQPDCVRIIGSVTDELDLSSFSWAQGRKTCITTAENNP